MDAFISFVKSNQFLLGHAHAPKMIASLVIIIMLWLLHYMIMRLVWHKVEDVHVRYRAKKIANVTVVVIGTVILARVWIQGFQSVTTFLGLLSAGLAIALKDIVANLAGWLFILWRRPFSTGDRIEVGKNSGDVIDMRLFQFTILEIGNWVDADQSTGRIIHVPNSIVLTHPLANYSRGFQYIWNEIPVLVTFESDWEKAKDILMHIAEKHTEHLSKAAQKKVREASREFLIFYSKLTPTVYTSVRDCGVLLTIRHLCEPRRRRGAGQLIWEDILRTFSNCEDIDFAYPTQRFYDNRLEGKKTPPSAPVAD